MLTVGVFIFFCFQLNYLLYRRVLVGMDEAFMLSMSNALQLADFLTLAFEYGMLLCNCFTISSCSLC